MDLDIIGKVLSCNSENELKTQFHKILNKIGIHSFAYIEISPCQSIKQRIISNYPQKWLERYVERHYELVDNVIHLCKVANQPFTWEYARESLKQGTIQTQYWTEASEFNLIEGISVPIVSPKKTIGFGYSLDKTENSLLWLHEYQCEIKILSAIFHQQSVRLIDSSKSIDMISNISAREVECAQWLCIGLTAVGVADKMKISERTVRFHLQELKQKLNVRTKEEVITMLAYHHLIDI